MRSFATDSNGILTNVIGVGVIEVATATTAASAATATTGLYICVCEAARWFVRPLLSRDEATLSKQQRKRQQ